MPKCIFCGKIFDETTGILSVQKNGDLHHICSKKCEKNKIIRKARTVCWTETYRKDKDRRMKLKTK